MIKKRSIGFGLYLTVMQV